MAFTDSPKKIINKTKNKLKVKYLIYIIKSEINANEKKCKLIKNAKKKLKIQY